MATAWLPTYKGRNGFLIGGTTEFIVAGVFPDVIKAMEMVFGFFSQILVV
jgi:hypothetical protein